jgi:Na+/proline symporter
VAAIRGRATTLVRDVTGDKAYGDVNYVFPTFVTERMPVGLVGLIIAAIFAAAMSSIAAELNSLSTATVIDFYRRLWRTDQSDAHYLVVSKLVTGFWGLVACLVAIFSTNLGPLIDVVNRFGSFFYGSLLGVFVLAIGTTRATSRGAFWGLLAGMAAVALVARYSSMAFLWHNVVGCAVVVSVGMLISVIPSRQSAARRG